MLGLFIFALIMTVVVGGATGMAGVGIFIGVLLFVCGLPAALITGYIHSENSYAQDREDARAERAEWAAEEREYLREAAADDRNDRLIDSLERSGRRTTYIDNRQVHYHGTKTTETTQSKPKKQKRQNQYGIAVKSDTDRSINTAALPDKKTDTAAYRRGKENLI